MTGTIRVMAGGGVQGRGKKEQVLKGASLPDEGSQVPWNLLGQKAVYTSHSSAPLPLCLFFNPWIFFFNVLNIHNIHSPFKPLSVQFNGIKYNKYILAVV